MAIIEIQHVQRNTHQQKKWNLAPNVGESGRDCGRGERAHARGRRRCRTGSSSGPGGRATQPTPTQSRASTTFDRSCRFPEPRRRGEETLASCRPGRSPTMPATGSGVGKNISAKTSGRAAIEIVVFTKREPACTAHTMHALENQLNITKHLVRLFL